MRDMVMQMRGSSGVLSVPDEYLPGLIAWLPDPVAHPHRPLPQRQRWHGGRSGCKLVMRSGQVNQVSQPMMHVWMTPVPGGPLTPDPSALNEVEADLKMPVLNPANGLA